MPAEGIAKFKIVIGFKYSLEIRVKAGPGRSWDLAGT
jgi:hypothetical protein